MPSYVPEYNFVDGFWLGAKFETGLKLSEASTLQFTPSAYYTTARKAVAGQSELSLSYAPEGNGDTWNCPAEFFLPIIMEKVENPV